MKSLRLILIAGMMFSWMVAGFANATGGIIHFSGSIVEGPCTVNVVDTTAKTACYRNGQNYQATRNLINVDASSNELPLNLGTSEVKWLDQQKKLAIMTLEYR